MEFLFIISRNSTKHNFFTALNLPGLLNALYRTQNPPGKIENTAGKEKIPSRVFLFLNAAQNPLLAFCGEHLVHVEFSSGGQMVVRFQRGHLHIDTHREHPGGVDGFDARLRVLKSDALVGGET